MLRPREFLLLECKNVRNLLHDTLRYAYSSKSSTQVYEECLARLQLIESELQAADDSDTEDIQELWVQLTGLAELIGRVERSHIEEFSWPFARALQSLAIDVCNDPRNPSESPLFFISAENDLASYEIDTEQGSAGLRCRSLFNIIFPRSLKHFSLLHPILGHEVAHAAFAVPPIGDRIVTDVLAPLTAGSPLSDRSRFQNWLQSVGQTLESDFIDYALLQWPEELYCDLFGLLMMGPSYLGATCTLSQPFDVRSASDSHPPTLTRYWMLESAITQLGWRPDANESRTGLGALKSAYFGAFSSLLAGTSRGFKLLRSSSIKLALANLREFLTPMGNALFEMPPAKSLNAMVRRLQLARPPVESTFSNRLTVTNDDIDFRSILFAGWLASHGELTRIPEPKFLNLNLLCDRGILQQSAVDYWKNEPLARRSSQA